MNQNLDQVTEILKQQGLTETQIGEFILALNNALSEHLYITIINALDEDDLAQLNTVPDDIQKQEFMRNRFQQKTGQNLQELSDLFITEFTNNFIVNSQDLFPATANT